MSDAFRPHPAPTRARGALIALAVLVAFAAGLGVAWYGLRWAAHAHPSTPAPVALTRPLAAAPAPVSAAALPTVATPDPAQVAARADLLAARLATIEQRTAITERDAAAAAGEAGRAEALLLAADARRAVEAGAGLGALEAPLRARFGAVEPRATALVIQAARAPLTAETLRVSFDALAPDLATGGGGWWRDLRQSLGTLVVIHREGEPSPLPADRIARARRLLKANAFEAAADELARLPDGGAARSWIAAARRLALTRRALDRLETAALAGLAAPVPTPTPGQPPRG